MSAWTKNLETAPRDRQVLARLPEWDCPSVVRYDTYDGEGYWCFVEKLLSDVAGSMEADEAARAEWALLPE